MSLLLQCALSLAVCGEDEPVTVWLPTWPAVARLLEGRIVEEGGRLNLLEYGDFVVDDPTAPRELFALRHGTTLRQLEWGVNRGSARGCPFLCLSRTHRFLPGESLTTIAEVYETTVETLLALNGWEEGATPDPWSLLQVPSLFRGPEDSRCLLVPMPKWALLQRGNERLRFDIGSRQVVVKEGDTWEEHAREAHCTPQVLARVNGQEGEDPPPVPNPGTSLLHCWTVHRELEDPLVPLVLFVELVLGVSLESVLEANDLTGVEAMRSVRVLELPFCHAAGYRSSRFTRGTSTDTFLPPGCRLDVLEAGGRPGVHFAIAPRNSR